jgi:hypothetical protein
MKSINEAYKRVYVKEEKSGINLAEIAIQIATIGQRVRMGKARASDGDYLIGIAKNIEKLQK